MPTVKISTKCVCFFNLYYCVRIRILPVTSAKRSQNHPHFTRLKIHKSADPHFTGGHAGTLGQHCWL